MCVENFNIGTIEQNAVYTQRKKKHSQCMYTHINAV